MSHGCYIKLSNKLKKCIYMTKTDKIRQLNSLFLEKLQTKRKICNFLSFMFQLQEGGFKVESWLSQQEESDTTGLEGINKSLQLVKQWTLDHVQPDTEYVHATNRFAISESGAIGISCEESPSLSVMYPETDKPLDILSNDKTYRSATFIKISKKEYLAVASDKDGCLYLWDIESKTPRKVFDPKLPIEKKVKKKIICKTDNSTIGYGEVSPLLDGSRRIFILKTDKEDEWTVCGTLKIFTPHDVRDMCHTEMVDGTRSLLFCIPHKHHIMAVEMVDGTTSWEVGKEHMGEKFKPCSICTEQKDCAYVADYEQHKIHLLSAVDGTVMKQFDVGGYYGILYIFTVRCHDQYLYVEQKIHTEKVKKYEIVKLKQVKEI